MGSLYIAFLYTMALATAETPHPLSDKFINLINAKQNLWKAGRNFPENTPLAQIIKLAGALPEDEANIARLPKRVHGDDVIANLPETFDPRDKWPHCPSLYDIRDQGCCGSCWAFGAVEAMTDRYCTYSNGSKHFHFSAEDVLSCCEDCGNGCRGGWPSIAWQFWKKVGIVSGGPYNSNQGCRPYEIAPYQPATCNDSQPTPTCVKSCEDGYEVEYKKDKKYAKEIYYLDGEEHIKAELFKNGPVEATFEVYSDFFTYKSGVYKHTEGELEGYHAIKILGWGVEQGTKYWMVANSWNSNWGDNGFFKILRGENHCNIEEDIVAGEPVLE